MPGFRKRVEEWLKVFSDLIYNNHYKTLLLMFILVGGIVSQVPKISVNTSLEGLLHEQDPILIEYNQFRDQFGREELIILAIKSSNIFNPEFLKKLKSLHNELDQNVPMTEKITSLITARNTYGENEELFVKELFEDWPKTDAELSEIKNRILKTPMYEHTLRSKNKTYATILIQTSQNSLTSKTSDATGGFDETDDAENMLSESESPSKYLTDDENSEIVMAVNKIARKHDTPDFKILIAGSPVVTHCLKVALFKDMTLFSIISSTLISLFLYLMFRRVSGVILPLIIVELSLLTTIGIMAVSGAILKIPFAILPSFILTVGVGDAVHILVFFYRNFNKTGDKKEAISYALSHSSVAIILTSITTAGGLLSFIAADIAPVADLGLYAAIGVMVALIYTIILLPALLSIMPLKKRKTVKTKGGKPIMATVLTRIGTISVNNPRTILAIAGIIFFISIYGITEINFFHNVVQWFPENDNIRIATETIDNELNGSISLEVVIDTQKENSIYDPEFLKKLDIIASELETYHEGDMFVGKVWSITTIIKEINRALNDNRQNHYFLPESRNVIAQELLLFENSGSDDIFDFTDNQFRKARIIIKVPAIDAIQYSQFISHVTEKLQVEFPEYDISVTGMMAILFSTIKKLISSMVKSYIVALLVITILMILLIGKFKIGFLSMIPNIFPIIVMLGLMGLLKIPMDMFSVLVGSIAIGIIVDDTVHFMHNYKKNIEIIGEPKKAAIKTLLTTGRAMLVTSTVLATGFFAYMFSSMNNLYNFGLLTGITIIIALLSDFFIAPALMVIAYKKN